MKEEMLKNRKPVHGKCLGKFFTEEEAEFLKTEACSRIEGMETTGEVIVDEETGETEPGTTTTVYFCKAYVNPDNWWKHSKTRCPLADHYRPDLKMEKSRVRAGQQKQKKH
jgi:hypothetical protein